MESGPDRDALYSDTSREIARHLSRCAHLAERLLEYFEADPHGVSPRKLQEARTAIAQGKAVAKLVQGFDERAFRLAGAFPVRRRKRD